MSIIQLHILKGTPARVKDREDTLVSGMSAMGYVPRTLMRVAAPDVMEFISGESVAGVGQDWQPNIGQDDICVVISFKR